MAEQRNASNDQLEQSAEINEITSKEQQPQTEPGIDYTKDFIWGSDQDEYIDEA